VVKEDETSEQVEKRKKESKNENFIILEEENDLSDEKIASLIASMSKSNRRQEDGDTIYSKAALLPKEEEEDVGSSGILPDHDHSEVPLAQVTIKNSQKLFPIDLERVREDLDILRTILKVRDFSVDVLFCTDAKICRLNRDYRDKLKPTDVLSFPITEFAPPEVLAETLHCPEERLLGDIIISPAYVYRQCLQDMQLAGREIANTELNSKMLQILEKESASPPAEPTEKDDDASQVQDGIDGSNDRGVSRAMASLYSFEDRLPLLLIHGLLHLLGHDHETSEDWLRMTQREDDVLQRYREYRQRSGAGAGNT
jgi:rRNA maturation RNase YbeY